MSKSWRLVVSLPLAAALAAPTILSAADPTPRKATTSVAAKSEPIRLHTYTKGDGGNYFALCLQPMVAPPAAGGTDVVVLFDTSASQIGSFREKSLAVLDASLARLGAADRVKLMAVDLEGVAFTKGFVAAGSQEMKAGLASLKRRTPLGATDMVAALKAAEASFDSANSQRRAVVYIGDGVSHANLAAPKQLPEMIAALVKKEIAVSSFAIGRKRDEALLSAVANQTGGMIAYDNETFLPADAGKFLAASASGVVAWPVSASWPTDVEVLPSRPLPLRLDRDTVFIGRGKLGAGQKIEIAARIAGRETKLAWTTPVAKASEDNAFLVRLVDSARNDRGVSLATVGADGLRIARTIHEREAAFLVGQARQAIVAGNLRGASPMIAELRTIDPSNPEVDVLEKAWQAKDKQRGAPIGPASGAAKKTVKTEADDNSGATMSVRTSPFRFVAFQDEEPAEPAAEPMDPAAEPLEPEAEPAAEPADPAAEPAAEPAVEPAAEPAVEPAAEPAAEPMAEEVPPAVEGTDQDFIDAVEREKRRQNDLMAKETEVAINAARRIMATNPRGAKENLKLQLDHLDRSPDLYPEVRAQLSDKVVVAIRQAEKREASLAEETAIAQAAVGAQIEARRIQERLLRDQEKVRQLVEQFRVLIDDGAYAEADESVAAHIEDIMPDTALSASTREVARASEAYRTWQYIYAQHVKRFNQTMQQVDMSGIPFPDNVPIIYPDAEVWEELTNRRKQYASVDLQKKGSTEEKIFRALGETADFGELLDTPLKEFADIIEQKYKIQVEIDTKALTDAGVDPEATTITRNLQGISLRSALRLILKEFDLKYVIRDEVLLITTADVAGTALTTKVYPVADLVLKIKDIGFAGGLSGALGGFGNFGGGNMNGGGGGDAFGGGGGGGGAGF